MHHDPNGRRPVSHIKSPGPVSWASAKVRLEQESHFEVKITRQWDASRLDLYDKSHGQNSCGM
jgi:hypothetical protein